MAAQLDGLMQNREVATLDSSRLNFNKIVEAAAGGFADVPAES